MYVVTFYSYQGGVGRTTALMNVAADLALRGRKVLLVDFDLAKPALTGFGPLRSGSPRSGVVEYITDYLQRSQSPPVEQYVHQTKIEDGEDCQVWVMPAGRIDDDYWEALARLDWQNLYTMRDGFLFLEDLKAQWRDILQVDYVLIDAPAGITDITRTCTKQLADDVVFLLGPDGSDLDGTGRVMKDVFTESIAEEPPRIDIYLAVSKVPDLDGDELPENHRLHALMQPHWAVIKTTGDSIAFEPPMQLPHDLTLLRGQQVIRSRRPRSRLVRQYQHLANDLILRNCTEDREGAKAMLKKLQKYPDMVIGGGMWEDPMDRWFDYPRKLDRIIKHFTAKGDTEVVAQAADCLYRARNPLRAVEVLGDALEQSPANPDLLWQQASYRYKEGDRRFTEVLMTLLNVVPQPARSPGGIHWLLKAQVRVPSIFARVKRNWLPELDTEPLPFDVQPLESISGIDPYIASAVRLLWREAGQRPNDQVAQERLQEALQSQRVKSLSPQARERLLSEEIPQSNDIDLEPIQLIHAGFFQEAITLLNPAVRGVGEPSFDSYLHLAMAYWGAGDEANATQVSQEALTALRLPSDLSQLLDELGAVAGGMVLLQELALLAFRAENLPVAGDMVFGLLGNLDEHLFQGTRFFSCWRYRWVGFDQFREDCRNLHLMIQQRIATIPISPPPFLSMSQCP